MPKITNRTVTDEDVEVTSDYCYGKAAEALTANAVGGYSTDLVREWRQLGDSLRDAEDSARWREENA